MNLYDENYIIRMADINDVKDIMSFIEREWKSDHILAQNREFFMYEFSDGDKINFIIAKEKETNEIVGILGFLPASKDKDNLDIWGVMWKVTDKKPVKSFLGIELMKRLIQLTKCRTEIGIGANPKTSIPLLKMMLKFNIGKMQHFYRLSEVKKFKIANVRNFSIINSGSKENFILKEFSNIYELDREFSFKGNEEFKPYKDSWYIDKRFFKHPIYSYKVNGICDKSGRVHAIIVFRKIECNGSSVLRIVDYIGQQSAFGNLYNTFECLLNDYEYIDFYEYGFENKYLYEAGFVEKTEIDVNIIPNYFEPFVQNNVDIWINSTHENCLFCKADGDQDRPNFY